MEKVATRRLIKNYRLGLGAAVPESGDRITVPGRSIQEDELLRRLKLTALKRSKEKSKFDKAGGIPGLSGLESAAGAKDGIQRGYGHPSRVKEDDSDEELGRSGLGAGKKRTYTNPAPVDEAVGDRHDAGERDEALPDPQATAVAEAPEKKNTQSLSKGGQSKKRSTTYLDELLASRAGKKKKK
jgi:hypothetical protein